MGSQHATDLGLLLSSEECGMVEALAKRWGLSVPDAMRRLVRDAYRAEYGDDEEEPPTVQPLAPGHEVHSLAEIREAMAEEQCAAREPSPLSAPTREVPVSELMRAAEAQIAGGPTRQISEAELLAAAERELQPPVPSREEETSAQRRR